MSINKVVYFADCMFSGEIDNIEDEFNLQVKPELEKHGLNFKNVKLTETPPFGKMDYDLLLFDWGGMSLGNDMLGSFCRLIVREASDKPNTFYVMTSSFTKYAMEDAINHLGSTHNIFLSISEFAKYHRKYLSV